MKYTYATLFTCPQNIMQSLFMILHKFYTFITIILGRVISFNGLQDIGFRSKIFFSQNYPSILCKFCIYMLSQESFQRNRNI